MTQSWANSGIDLHLVLDRSGRRLAASMESALREAVRDGRLGPGTRLPPSRALAADLGVARNTVAAVYGRLVEEGWLDARQGSGTHVATGQHIAAAEPRPRLDVREDEVEFDLRAGFPDVSRFPVADWTAALRQAVAAAPTATLGYGPEGGLPDLRDAVAAYLGRTRGVATHPADVVITSGFTHALGAVSEMLRDRGATAVGVESHGHATHRQVLLDAGLEVVPLDVDDSGVTTTGLDGLDAVLLTPAHQFPLGVALSPSRRAAVVRWAVDADTVIIEDDYDGEFRYDRAAVGALQPHAPDHVIYAGTTSKTLGPGVGLGWLAAPVHLGTDLARRQRRAGPSPRR